MESTDFRKYNMTNSELAMFVSNLVQSMKRDETELNTKGITPTMRNELEDMGNEFEVFPNDVYYRADVMIAVDSKNESRSKCEIMLREIVGIAAIKWGERSPQVKRMDAGRMTKMGDKVFVTMVRFALFAAEEYLPELAAYGLTQGKIDALAAELALMETAMLDIAKFAMIRELKAIERQSMANDLYKTAARYCEAGKIIFQDTDLAKYDTYVIRKASR